MFAFVSSENDALYGRLVEYRQGATVEKSDPHFGKLIRVSYVCFHYINVIITLVRLLMLFFS